MKLLKAGACSILLVVALGVAGCGSDDSSSGDSSSDSITKADFVAQANAICAESNAKIEAAENEAFSGGQQPTEADIESFVTGTLIPEVEQQVSDIEALDVPEDEVEQVNAILDAAQEGLDEAKADPASLAGNADPFAQANRLASDYGLTECAG